MDKTLTYPLMDGIIWISLPENFLRTIGDVKIDSSVKLPVEIQCKAEEWKPKDLTNEALVAGMLRILAKYPDIQNADYYRNFVLAYKPNILKEFSEAGILKAKNKDFAIAEEIFMILKGLFPTSYIPILNCAIMYEDQAANLEKIDNHIAAEICIEKAFESYRQLLSNDETAPDVYFNAGFFYLRRHEFEKARNLFKEYMSLGDDEYKKEKAEEIFNKLDNQAYLDTLFRESYDFILMGKEEEGIAKIKEFLVTYPKVWNAWFLLGWAYRKLSKWQEGREALEKACELGGNETDTLNELSICLLELGSLASAKKVLHEALRKESDNVKIIANLGILALKEGNTEEARGFFRTALEIEPEDPVSLAYLQQLGNL